jgi:predicted negative regulator of RcsB-dependent stress response
MIIDFYYDLYMYLKKIKDEESANKTLEDLNNFQNSFKVFVYSPVVELELAKIAKDSKNYELAVKNLKDALLHTRNIKKEDEVRIYYELANLYQELKDNENRFEFLQKCKDIKLDDNLYKTMCESMN